MSANSGTELLLSVALLVVAIVVLIVLVPSPEEKASWQYRELAAPTDEILTATISYLQDLGYAIDTIDRDSGFVKTQYAGRGQLQGGLGVIVDILVGEARYAATVQVTTGGAQAAHVRVNLIAEQWNEGSWVQTGHWSQDSLAYSKADYDKFFDGLRKKLGLGWLDEDNSPYVEVHALSDAPIALTN